MALRRVTAHRVTAHPVSSGASLPLDLAPIGSPLLPGLPVAIPRLVPRAVVRQVVHRDLPLAIVVLFAVFLLVQAVVDRRDPRLDLAPRRRDEGSGQGSA